MEPRDIACLTKIVENYGGKISTFKHTPALRYRLHNKAGLVKLVNDLNGLLQNPVRLTQLKNVCRLYSIRFIEPRNFTFLSHYLAGLIDSDGSVYYNSKSIQRFITISQKDRYLLDLIQSIYGGKVYPANVKRTAFK